MATITNLSSPAKDWGVGGTPLPSMMAIEHRKGKEKPVIRKALVELEGAPFKIFETNRKEWAAEDCYRWGIYASLLNAFLVKLFGRGKRLNIRIIQLLYIEILLSLELSMVCLELCI